MLTFIFIVIQRTTLTNNLRQIFLPKIPVIWKLFLIDKKRLSYPKNVVNSVILVQFSSTMTNHVRVWPSLFEAKVTVRGASCRHINIYGPGIRIIGLKIGGWIRKSPKSWTMSQISVLKFFFGILTTFSYHPFCNVLWLNAVWSFIFLKSLQTITISTLFKRKKCCS